MHICILMISSERCIITGNNPLLLLRKLLIQIANTSILRPKEYLLFDTFNKH